MGEGGGGGGAEHGRAKPFIWTKRRNDGVREPLVKAAEGAAGLVHTHTHYFFFFGGGWWGAMVVWREG
jgi:hypothetical protein